MAYFDLLSVSQGNETVMQDTAYIVKYDSPTQGNYRLRDKTEQ